MSHLPIFGDSPVDPSMPDTLFINPLPPDQPSLRSVDIDPNGSSPSLTIDWVQDSQGNISDFRVTKGVARYETPWWRRLILRLLPGKGWTYVRFHD